MYRDFRLEELNILTFAAPIIEIEMFVWKENYENYIIG